MGTEELQKEAQGFNLIKVTDAESLERAGILVRQIKEFLRRVANVFDPIDAAQIAARKVTITQRKALEEKPMALDRAQRAEMGAYEETERRKVQEAEAAAAHERQHLEDEARLQAALKAEAEGKGLMAERILEAPKPPTVTTVPFVVKPPPPKAEGFGFKTNYRVEVTDLKLLVMAAAAGEVSLEYLLPNLPALNQAARNHKGNVSVPGVRIIAERMAVST